MQKYRRLIVPLGLVFGTLACAYISFFVGIKDDFPQPAGSERYPLSTSKQATALNAWPETASLKTPDASIYTLREEPTKAAAFYRDAFVTKRGWKEITPPGQPKDIASGQEFVMLAFSRGNNKTYIALSTARSILANDTEFNKAIRSNNLREGDNIALVILGMN